MAQDTKKASGNGAVDRLKSEAQGLLGALGDRAAGKLRGKVEDTVGRLGDYVEGGAGPGLMAAVTGAKGMAEGKSPGRSMLGAGMAAVKEKVKGMFGKGGQGKKLKMTNIVESIDVGAPVTLVYNQWTQFTDFPSFMKKVENVDQSEDEKLNWKAQVFWSHRTWEATIREQAPDDKIIWRSKGDKGYVDGAVTFHELTPNLTRILVVLEYHPQGLFERTGNIWRAQGRRARLELKHFRRHVMSEGLLHPDDIQGWRGVIRDGEVVEEDETPPNQDAQDQGEEAAEDQEVEYAEAGQDVSDEDASDQYDGDAADKTGDRDAADKTGDEEAAEEDSDDGAARERPARSGRAPARRRQPAARSRQGSRNGRAEERPQRASSRAGARGRAREG